MLIRHAPGARLNLTLSLSKRRAPRAGMLKLHNPAAPFLKLAYDFLAGEDPADADLRAPLSFK
jgi:hypothetical protein